MVPRILYWRNNSREADWLAKELTSTDVGGELQEVDSKQRFLAELDRPRTDLIVTHEDLVSEPILKTIQERCPRAGVLLLCDNEQELSSKVKDSVTHILSMKHITDAIPAVKSAIRHSSRMFKSPFSSDTNRTVMELVSDAVIVESPEHRIIRWNPAAERLFGWSSTTVLGKNRKDILIEIEQSNEATTALENDGRWSGEVLYIAANSRHIDVLSQRRKLPEGGWIEVCTDVSDLRFGDRKTRLLASTHTLLNLRQQSIEQSLDSFAKMAVPLLADTCIIDLRGDDDIIRHVGFASRDPSIAGVERALKDDFPLYLSTFNTTATVLRTGKCEQCKNVINPGEYLGVQDPAVLTAFQRSAPLSALTVPISGMGKVTGLLTLMSSTPNRIMEAEGSLVLQELAAVLGSAIERAHLEQRLRIERMQSHQATLYKDTFLGVISHELRTPLQAMLGWTQLLRDARLTRDAAAKALDSLERSIKTQGQIISDLLDLSRISAGRLELDTRPCELLPLVAAAVRSCELQARLKDIQISAIELKSSAIWISADLNWLQRAFFNIVSNAVKFTPSGGKVHIAIESDSMYAKVSISDTGKGIESAFLSHVFECFSQAEIGTTRTHSGLGVGLSIVRHIVESHGGTVEAHSAGDGKGAQFVVSLPICPAPQNLETAEPAKHLNNGGSLQGLRILLVEDETDTRELLRFVLEQAGATVTEAATTQEGFRCANQGHYNVLVSDIGLPEEDGNSLIRRIRALPPGDGGNIAALALTAYARTEDRVNALRAGFNVHVCKPVEPSELILMVAELGKRASPEK